MENNNNNKNNNRELSRENRGYGLLDPFFNGFFRFPTFKEEFREMEKLMKTDVHEKEQAYELEVELAGFDKKDINIELSNGYLTIEAKKESLDEEDEKKNYIRRERFYGNCARSFYVGDIEREDISASLTNGILHITIPKEKNEEQQKRIEIK